MYEQNILIHYNTRTLIISADLAEKKQKAKHKQNKNAKQFDLE